MDEALTDAADEDARPTGARRWLSMIDDAEKAFNEYREKCTRIEELYASLKTMSEVIGDRQMKLFWANMEVLKPTIYQRPPQPVVQQRFKQRNPIAREAAEMLERVLAWDVDDDDLHTTLLHVRDDMALCARGVPWVLDNGSCIHVDRVDFLHDPARKWAEVGWVGRRAYLGRAAFRERFPNVDRTLPKFDYVDPSAEDFGAKDDYRSTSKKAQVWEVWSKEDQKVYWVTEGVEDVLDESEPLINVKGFFPCPRPAYATCEPRTLKPVPDYIYYRDQLDEINELTARISSLCESLRVKGFYASGAKEVGEAIETAMRATDNKAILVPVSSMAALGGGGMKDAIVWLPVEEVVRVVQTLIETRKQLIEDVYEISGISDIMRGETVASETATAQNLKAQYGSVRVRERQNEMARIARDVIAIKAEIFAETVPVEQLAHIAQMRIPTMDQVQQQLREAAAQGQPFDANKIVTIEQIGELLASERIRPFVLDIETDSTIAPNEQEEKRSRTEFIGAVGGFLSQAAPLVQQQPEAAEFTTEMLKFAAGAFRAGRPLEASLDEFTETVKAAAQQAQQMRGQPPPEVQIEQTKLQMDAERTKLEAAEKSERLKMDQAKMQAELAFKQVSSEGDAAIKDRELAMKEAELELKRTEMGLRAQDLRLRDREEALQAGEQGVNDDRVGIEEIMAKIEEERAQMADMLAQLAAAQAEQAQAMQQGMALIAEAMNRPKRVLRENGQVVGVE